jgi:hypothetical protein
MAMEMASSAEMQTADAADENGKLTACRERTQENLIHHVR